MSTPDKRIKCPKCNTITWSTDYIRFMQDHDRPDGRRCNNTIRVQYQQTVSKPALGQ